MIPVCPSCRGEVHAECAGAWRTGPVERVECECDAAEHEEAAVVR